MRVPSGGWRQPARNEPFCHPWCVSDERRLDEIAAPTQQRVHQRPRKQMQVCLSTLGRGIAQRQVLGSICDEVVPVTVRIVTVARPFPRRGGADHTSTNWVEVAVPHHLELAP